MAQNPLSIQMDLTAFYDADEAISIASTLRGNPFGSVKHEDNYLFSYLAFIATAAIFFEKIIIPLPSVFDKESTDSFTDDAPNLVLKLKKALNTNDTKVIEIPSLTATQKEMANTALTKHTALYTSALEDFFISLEKDEMNFLNEWATRQLTGPRISNNTTIVETESPLHNEWTMQIVEKVISTVKDNEHAVLYKSVDPAIADYVIKICTRGLIYHAAADVQQCYYLPHYHREGLLQSIADDQSQVDLLTKFMQAQNSNLGNDFDYSRSNKFDPNIINTSILMHAYKKERFKDLDRVVEFIVKQREKSKGLRTRLLKEKKEDIHLVLGNFINEIDESIKSYSGFLDKAEALINISLSAAATRLSYTKDVSSATIMTIARESTKYLIAFEKKNQLLQTYVNLPLKQKSFLKYLYRHRLSTQQKPCASRSAP